MPGYQEKFKHDQKNTRAERKIAADGLIHRLHTGEERTSDLEDVSTEFLKIEKQS